MTRQFATALRNAVLLTVLLCTLPLQVSAQTQTQPASCAEIEVVMLVDQSGSMPGSPDHPEPNDPLGLRFFAPLRVVRWMGQDFLGASGLRLPSRPIIRYNLAVVDFGDQARVRLPWTTIAPASDQAWQQRVQDLSKVMGPQVGDMGNTNMVAAFEAVRNLFQQRAAPIDGCPRRAVFFLSDGLPYVKPPDETTKFSVNQHMRDVARLLREDLTSLGAEVWITAIDNEGAYWPVMEPMWQSILPQDVASKQPHTRKVNSEDEIGERFVKLMVELADRSIEPVQIGPRCVPPYLQEIVLTFYKRAVSEHLEALDPIGPLLTSRTDLQVRISGYDEPIESVTVRSPLPGKWQITTNAPRADVIIDEVTLPATGRLIKPTGSQAVQYVQSRTAFQITDSQGSPLPAYADPTFALSVAAAAQSNLGSTSLSFALSAQEGYAADFIPTQAGTYQLRVSATSREPRDRVPVGSADCEWKPFDVLKDEVVGQFDVAPSAIVSAGAPQIVSSASGCPLQVGDRVIVGYQSQRTDTQQPVVFSLPVDWRATLESGGISQNVKFSGPQQSGIYSTTLEFGQYGNYSLNALASVRLPDGTPQQLMTDKLDFDVKPVHQLLAVVRLAENSARPWWWQLLNRLGLIPKSVTAQIGRDPLWRLLPTEVEVLVSLDGQNPLDPATALRSESLVKVPVKLVVSQVGGINPQVVALEPTSAAGRYHATVPPLGLGQYELRVEGAQGLVATCGYTLPTAVQTTLQRTENPFVYAELALAITVILILLSLWRRQVCLRRNPCKGFVRVVDAEGKKIGSWYKGLDGRNTWHLRNDNAPPAKCGIQEMTIRSTRGTCGREPYQGNQIWIQIVPLSLKRGERETPIEYVLEPKKSWKPERLAGYAIVYVLDLKDVDKSIITF